MSDRLKPIAGAWVANFVVAFIGVTYIFGPMSANAPESSPIFSTPVSIAVFGVIGVLFFDWVVQQWGNPVKPAMILALSQLLFVDVFYVFIGNRGIGVALTSAVILLIGAWAYGTAYAKLSS